ncbi:MAG: hypothetical protein WC748_05135 [Legionellales bacterium]
MKKISQIAQFVLSKQLCLQQMKCVKKLSSTKALVVVLRANLREKEREIFQQKDTIEDLNGKLKITQ